MRSHRFVNSLLYLVIQLVGKESKVKEDSAWIRRFFVLFLDKRYICQVIHLKGLCKDISLHLHIAEKSKHSPLKLMAHMCC